LSLIRVYLDFLCSWCIHTPYCWYSSNSRFSWCQFSRSFTLYGYFLFHGKSI